MRNHYKLTILLIYFFQHLFLRQSSSPVSGEKSDVVSENRLGNAHPSPSSKTPTILAQSRRALNQMKPGGP